MNCISNRIAAVIAIFILVTTSSCFDASRESALIRKTVKDYSNAVSAANGAESVKYLDSASLKYYDYILTLIQCADSFTVEHLRFDQKILVLAIRHSVPQDKIAKMNGKALFAYCVRCGLVGVSTFTDHYLKITSVGTTTAATQLVDSNNKAGIIIKFNKEDGVWKISLLSILNQIDNGTWLQMTNESGRTEREFYYACLEEINGIKPKDDVWQPHCPGN